MKRLFFVAAVVAFINLCMVQSAVSAESIIKVNNIEELQPYLKQSDIHVVVAPGTYRVTEGDIKQGKYSAIAEVTLGQPTHSIILVEGNNSTYDFTGVTLEIETAVFNAYEGRYYGFHEFHITGSNNTVKNLKIVDVGESEDAPKYGCLNILIDGASNLVEGFEVNSKGSYPYGYGELFGKGGKNVIRHRKHSACLVRGYKSHVKNCTIKHRAYGHCLFFQAADMPLVEGCYIEGEIIMSDEVLKERGTGSEADKVDFMTYWGYTVPAGHAMALCEEGIRAYNGGSTIIDGVRYSRGASNVTVKDCVIKNTRGGVTLTHATGFKYVENCTAIGCNRGFAVGDRGKLVNCFADTKNGPALGVDYENDSNIVADITILAHEGKTQNGTTHVAIIIGRDHHITLRRGEGLKEDKSLEINMGGDAKTIGQLGKVDNYRASGITLINETRYPVVLDDNTSDNSGTTAGKIIDNGTNNTIVKR